MVNPNGVGLLDAALVWNQPPRTIRVKAEGLYIADTPNSIKGRLKTL